MLHSRERSTIQRRGSTLKPGCPRERETTAMVGFKVGLRPVDQRAGVSGVGPDCAGKWRDRAK
jgi:hypothetical protein